MADPESEKYTKDLEAWRNLFPKLVQDEGKSYIDISDLEEAVKDIKSKELRTDCNVEDYELKQALKDLRKTADEDNDGKISLEEWMKYYPKHPRGNTRLLSALEFLMYKPTCHWLPPPIFMLSLTIIQVGFYIWHDAHISSIMGEDASRPLPGPRCSYLIYEPKKREQV